MLTLRAFGKLALKDEHGCDFAPNGQKARGLLVLLAVAPSHTRTRAWLQDKLWSDRTKEQASGSLRTSLAEIRRSLGEYSGILRSDRTNVSLDPTEFRVNYTRPSIFGMAGAAEPFEDVDVKDPEFEHLIRDLRSSVLDSRKTAPPLASTPQSPLTVQIVTQLRGGILASVAAQVIAERIRATLDHTGEFHTIVSNESAMQEFSSATFFVPTLRLLTVDIQGELFVSCSLNMDQDGAEEWSTSTVLPGTPSAIRECIEVDRLSLLAIDRIVDLATRRASARNDSRTVLVLEHEAKKLVFQLDKPSLITADRLLARAFEFEPRGRYLAWRGFLRDLSFFQHRSTAFFEDQTSALDFSVEALRHSPDDPGVQAIASQLDYVHQGRLATSLAMARQAAEIDPTNPLAWAILSNSLAANDRRVESYETARRSVALTAGSRFQFFFEHFACMSAAASRNYEQAMVHARTALRFRPEFVSTRRYEVALAMQLENPKAVRKSVEAMRRSEPEFQTTTLLEPDYPVTTLRRLPLIDAIR